jgi:hypothetical protein
MDTLDRYVGKYSIGSVRILTITRDGYQLNAQISGQPKLPIYPEMPPKFRWRTINAQVTFAIENGRPATNATIHQGGGDIVATRLDETATRSIEAKLASRIRDQLPQPGSEAAVQKFFAAMSAGTPNYGDMTDALRDVLRRQLDPDHLSRSASHAAQDPPADGGHSIVSRSPRLRTWIRIGRSGCAGAFAPVMATGTKVGLFCGAQVPSPGTKAVFMTASFTQRRSRFALSLRSRATPASDAPGTRHAATDCALKASE